MFKLLRGAYYSSEGAYGPNTTSQALAEGRIGYEGHIGRLFSMEPSFSVLQSIGPYSYRTYAFNLSFAIWNEAVLGSIVSGLIAGSFHH